MEQLSKLQNSWLKIKKKKAAGFSFANQNVLLGQEPNLAAQILRTYFYWFNKAVFSVYKWGIN